MREIKFRAWNPLENKMLSSENLTDQSWNVLESITKHYGKWIFMQFTELKDKNGKEIYEGDIVKYIIDASFSTGMAYPSEIQEAKEIIEEVRWANEIWSFVPELTEPFEFEVIGNIYENKELLK